MPASPSRNRELKAPRKSRRLVWPILLLVVMALAIVMFVLPASLIGRLLPPQVKAEDFSGSIWHGSSGRVAVSSLAIGAVEWRLHPLSLLSMQLAAEVRWVRGAGVVDGDITVDRNGFEAHNVRGSGPVADLSVGALPGWSGDATLDLQSIKGTFETIESAAGNVQVSSLSSNTVAHGAQLGGYSLTVTPSVAGADMVAAIKDMGGPLDAQADVHYTPASHTGLLSGTVKERESATPALREELSRLAQMRPRDNLGRIPVELELAL